MTTDSFPALRILYVDDDVDLRESIVQFLGDAGYEVDAAHDAESGLARLSTHRYDLVITDYSMPPGETGGWMLREARRLGLLDETACCVLTANVRLDGEVDCEILRKPVDVDVLLDSVHRLLAPARAIALARAREQLGDALQEATMSARIDFVLYISAASPSSVKAVRNMTKLIAEFEMGQIGFSIRDLSREPLRDGDPDRVAFTPTLVKQTPAPRTWVIGDLDNIAFVKDLITYAGVERKR